MSLRYLLAGENIIWEKLGNHIVIAELKTGKYCNIGNFSGVQIWESLLAGSSETEIIQSFSKNYHNFDPLFQQQTLEFIKKLEKLNFIVKNNHPTQRTDALPIPFDPHSRVFESPQLIIYDDITTLLQLDPIDDEFEDLIVSK